MNISEILPRISGISRSGSGYMGRCPAHDDKTPSLSVTEAKDGSILLKCHAGCSFDEIVKALSIEPRDLFPDRLESAPSQNGRVIETESDFFDEEGTLLFQEVRFSGKEFRLRRPDGSGGWIWNTHGVRRVLYRLRELIKAVEQGNPIYLPEGPKDVETLRALGLEATCNVAGAGKWRDEYSVFFSGADVIVLPDSDAPGKRHASEIAHSVHGQAASVRIVAPPGLTEKQDITDWFSDNHTRQDLEELVRRTPEWTPTTVTEKLATDSSKELDFMDLANARRYADDHRGDTKYVAQENLWICYAGQHWEVDHLGRRHSKANETAREMMREALDISDPDAQKKALKWAYESQKDPRLEAMVKRARYEKDMTILPKDLDRQLDFLNVENGTIDLTTGELLDHNKSDLITKLAPVRYDPDATCPRWKQFISEIFEGDEELCESVQRDLGYSLTAHVTEDVLFILYGYGRNGKTTLLELIRCVLGDYAQAARPELLLPRRTGGASEEEAVLKGARFVHTSETGSGKEFDEAKVKRLTGGDTIRARRVYGHEFEFEPSHKIWLATNHRPVIEGTDKAIWKRIHLIPFNATFEGDAADTHLLEKLQAEAPGILNWLIEGCLEWRKGGLKPARVIEAATNEYRSDMDTLGAFLDECCVVGDMYEDSVQATRLHAEYKAWCEQSGEKPATQREFGQRMTERGFKKKKQNDGVWYVGVGLKK